MPELPEVETVCRTLHQRIRGVKILRVWVLEGRLRQPVAADFAARLRGRTVAAVTRRGKYILAALDRGRTWVTHLGMSGKLTFRAPGARPDRHDHIVFRLADGRELRYHDPRRFGLCVVLPDSEIEAWPPLARLGLDPLDPRFTGDYLYPFLHRSRRNVRDLLLDQQVAAGLGNIYVNEALFRIGVRPTRRGSRISRALAGELASEVTALLREAIRWRGASVSDYRDGNDHRGGFQLRLQVYGRGGEPCRGCGAPVKRVGLGNRGAFYCPRCQR